MKVLSFNDVVLRGMLSVLVVDGIVTRSYEYGTVAFSGQSGI